MRAAVALVLVIAALTAGCASDDEERTALPTGSETVELDPARFTAEIDNPYWPMRPGTTWVYREGTQRVEITVTHDKKEVMGIEARVVHDLVTEDGETVEDTLDWYAQDADGNVWYLGEDTKEYHHDEQE
jgi:ABC-type Fe3+-hydroxamate transport system substrate-binding protein